MTHHTDDARRELREVEREQIDHRRLQLLEERQIVKAENLIRIGTATQAVEAAEQVLQVAKLRLQEVQEDADCWLKQVSNAESLNAERLAEMMKRWDREDMEMKLALAKRTWASKLESPYVVIELSELKYALMDDRLQQSGWSKHALIGQARNLLKTSTELRDEYADHFRWHSHRLWAYDTPEHLYSAMLRAAYTFLSLQSQGHADYADRLYASPVFLARRLEQLKIVSHWYDIFRHIQVLTKISTDAPSMITIDQWLAECNGTEHASAVGHADPAPKTSKARTFKERNKAKNEFQMWSAYHTAYASWLNEQPDKTSTWSEIAIKGPVKTRRMRSRLSSTSSVLSDSSFTTACSIFDPDQPRSYPPVPRICDQGTQTDTVTYWDAHVAVERYGPSSPEDVQRAKAEVKAAEARKDAIRYEAVRGGGDLTLFGKEMTYADRCRYRTARIAEVRWQQVLALVETDLPRQRARGADGELL